MTDPTFDPRLAERILDYSRAAVVPIDPVAVADAALTAGRRRRPRRLLRPFRFAPRQMLAWLIALVVVGVIVASVAGGLVGNQRHLAQTPPTPPSVVAPIAGPSGTPPSGSTVATASPSSTSSSRAAPVAERGGGHCLTDWVQVATGAAMRPAADQADAMPRLGTGQGVVITTRDPTTSDLAEIWSLGRGRPTAERVGEISGAANWLNVLGISSSGSQALLRIGHYLGPDWELECADLYLVAVDGSEARRLTTFSRGQSVIGGAIAPDGSKVAYAARAHSLAVDVAVIDVATGATVHEPSGCSNGTGGLRITVTWSNEIDRFAVDCDEPVIYDPTGRTAPVAVAEHGIGIGWEGRSLTVAAPLDTNHFRVDTADPASGHIVRGTDIATTAIDWAGGSGKFAPSGRLLVAEGYVGATASTYVIGATTSAPRAVAPGSLFAAVDWSTDELSLIYPDLQTQTLYQVDVSTGIKTNLGTLPRGYQAGAWRLP